MLPLNNMGLSWAAKSFQKFHPCGIIILGGVLEPVEHKLKCLMSAVGNDSTVYNILKFGCYAVGHDA